MLDMMMCIIWDIGYKWTEYREVLAGWAVGTETNEVVEQLATDIPRMVKEGADKIQNESQGFVGGRDALRVESYTSNAVAQGNGLALVLQQFSYQFRDAGMGPIMRQYLEQQRDAIQAFADVLVGKAPSVLVPPAVKYSLDAVRIWNETIEMWPSEKMEDPDRKENPN